MWIIILIIILVLFYGFVIEKEHMNNIGYDVCDNVCQKRKLEVCLVNGVC